MTTDSPRGLDAPQCPVCDGDARIVTDRQPGYRAPHRFAIAACSRCGTSHARPFEASSEVYEAIYRQADVLPGYERYARYARATRRARDPLAYIGSREDVYWCIARYLAEREPAAVDPVLEIGSGLGYLTYAMRRAGFDAAGIDLSREAVARACRRFGPFYEAADAIALAGDRPGHYGLVVMAETIEHVSDFHRLMQAVAQLLRPGGEAIVTTPNRSFYRSELVWETDPPPVHLLWFTEEALREIGRRCGMDVRFVDFAELNRTEAPAVGPDGAGITRGAMLDERGAVAARWPLLRRLLPVGAIYDVLTRARARRTARRLVRQGRADPHAGRRGTIGAVFSKR